LVARERKFLSFVAAPPLEAVRAFVTRNLERDYPHFLAIVGERVVGWCDAPGPDKEGFQHTGYLGLGVHRDFRGQGIGKDLLTHTIHAAFKGPLSHIELDVFANNAAAISLYLKFGFRLEGRKRRARIIDGITEDILIMSLLREEFPISSTDPRSSSADGT
jgi:RimJ/RimL family protein N-acetyltransferase